MVKERPKGKEKYDERGRTKRQNNIKFSALYGNRRSMMVFTKAHLLAPIRNQTIPDHTRKQ
jgi:hypothetical protein